MKVRTLEVENLLSFDHLNLSFDPDITVLVGPNGSGKTSVVRVLDLISTALDWVELRASRPYPQVVAADAALRAFAQARHRGADSKAPIVIRLGLDLTTAWERELLTAFMQSALVSTVVAETTRPDDQQALASWAVEQAASDKLEPLFTGTIVLEHVGAAHTPWQLYYEFGHAGETYCWILAHRRLSPGLVRSDFAARASSSAIQIKRVIELLFGIAPASGSSPALPASLPPFDLARLFPPEDSVVDLAVRAEGHLDPGMEPHRSFVELAGIDARTLPSQQHYSLARVLRRVVQSGLVIVGEQFRGVGTVAAAPRPAGVHSWEDFAGPPPPREPHGLPLRLLRLKNGDDRERLRYERMRELFSTLAPGLSFDLGFEVISSRRATPPEWAVAGGDGDEEAGAPSVKVTVSVRDESLEQDEGDSLELPIEFFGAGTWEALVIAEAIADADDRLVVLDEPALNLHPTWQRVLRARLLKGPGQFLLITHSPYLVPVDSGQDLSRLIRFSRERGVTRANRLTETLDPTTTSRLVREFSLSADARALLFARGVVLLEGLTELGALPVWFRKSLTAQTWGTPEDLDLAFYSVGGYTNFQPNLTLLAALGIPWVVICDGAAFAMGRNHVFHQAVRANAADPALQAFVTRRLDTIPGMDEGVFEEFVGEGAKHGILTLAGGWATADKKTGTPGDESFEIFVERVAPGKLEEAAREVGESKVRCGRWVAEEVSCPEEVDGLYAEVLDALRARNRHHTASD